jgi:hypothetical protein
MWLNIGLLIALLAAGLANPIEAQAPIKLEARAGTPYAVLEYNYTEFQMDLEARRYAFAAWNEAATESEFWIRQGAREVHHRSFRYDVFSSFVIPQEGTYTVHVNGRGRFSLADQEFTDRLLTDANASAHHTFVNRFLLGLFVSQDQAGVCLSSATPFSVSILDDRLRTTGQRDVQNQTWIAIPGKLSKTFLAINASSPGPTDLDLKGALNCEVVQQTRSAGTRPTSVPNPSIGIALAALLVAASRGRRR